MKSSREIYFFSLKGLLQILGALVTAVFFMDLVDHCVLVFHHEKTSTYVKHCCCQFGNIMGTQRTRIICLVLCKLQCPIQSCFPFQMIC